MKQFVHIVSLLIASFLAIPAAAEPVCLPTAKVATSRYPGAAAIPSTNNLVLPTGKPSEIEGQKLVITGQVIDKNCIPVPNAVVELWQATPYGLNRVAPRDELATPYAAFAGAGRAITDGNGQFTFITAFPGTVLHPTGKRQYIARAPQLNIRVNAPGIADFSTALFFENDHRNYTDPVYKKLSLEKRSGVTISMMPNAENLFGSIQLVLPGVARYRTY